MNNGTSQTVSTWPLQGNFVILISLDHHNNAKDFTVSHLTAQEQPKRLSQSADETQRSGSRSDMTYRMQCDCHQYFLVLSEKCILKEVSALYSKMSSEMCQQHVKNVDVLLLNSQILSSILRLKTETHSKGRMNKKRENPFLGMSLQTN